MPFFLRQLQQSPPELPTNDPTHVAIIMALTLLQVAIGGIAVAVMVIAALREIIPRLTRHLRDR